MFTFAGKISTQSNTGMWSNLTCKIWLPTPKPIKQNKSLQNKEWLRDKSVMLNLESKSLFAKLTRFCKKQCK